MFRQQTGRQNILNCKVAGISRIHSAQCFSFRISSILKSIVRRALNLEIGFEERMTLYRFLDAIECMTNPDLRNFKFKKVRLKIEKKMVF